MTTSTAAESRSNSQEQQEANRQREIDEKIRENNAKKATKIEADAVKALSAIVSLATAEPPVTATLTAIRDGSKLSGKEARYALDQLVVTERIEKYDAKVKTGNGGRPIEAYRVRPNTPEQGRPLP